MAWYETFFDAAAMDLWMGSQPDDLTAEETAFVFDALGLTDAGDAPRVLDVPSGPGRHVVGLAKRGCRVTGVDLADENQGRFVERMAEAGVAAELLQRDMRNLDGLGPFDGALCWGNSFGYFPRAECVRFLRAVRGVLAPGAAFLLDTACSAESMLPEMSRRSWQETPDGSVVLFEREYAATESRIEMSYTVLRDDRVVDRRTAHQYVFTSGDHITMAEEAGLLVDGFWSDLERSPFELGDERLIVRARRGPNDA